MRNSLELKKAQIRLTVIHSIMIGVILSVIVWVMFHISLHEYHNEKKSEFLSKSESIVDKVKNLVSASNVWLSQVEEQDQMLIELSVNGQSLEPHATWMPRKKRDQLFQDAITKAAKQGIDLTQSRYDMREITRTNCEIKQDNNDYCAYIAIIPESVERFRSVILIKDISVETSFFTTMFTKYLMINIGGIILFVILSYVLIAKLLKPVKLAEERQSEFIACASHELKSPVAVIRSSAETIKIDTKQRDTYLDNIENECTRLAHLVDDMLLLSRSGSSNQWITTQQAVSMDTLLVEVFDAYYMVCKKAGFTLELELSEEEIGDIRGDKDRIKQVLFILLDNAITYSKPAGSITIHGLHKRHMIYVSVEDHGIGIKQKEKQRVFDRFYRINQENGSGYHAGLGLSIAKELVQLHHGTIGVIDTAGGGSTFYIELPINEVQNKVSS